MYYLYFCIILTFAGWPRIQNTFGHNAFGEGSHKTARGHTRNRYPVPGTRPSLYNERILRSFVLPACAQFPLPPLSTWNGNLLANADKHLNLPTAKGWNIPARLTSNHEPSSSSCSRKCVLSTETWGCSTRGTEFGILPLLTLASGNAYLKTYSYTAIPVAFGQLNIRNSQFHRGGKIQSFPPNPNRFGQETTCHLFIA